MKKSISALITAVIFLAVACGEGDRVPGEYIDKEKMSGILVDMTIADAYSNEMSAETLRLPDSLRQEKVKVFYKQILDLHKVTVKDFTTSYAWYESHPDRMKEMFELVQASITARKNKLGNPIEENAPLMFRLKSFFPNAEHVILVPKSDTTRPFVKRQL